MTTEELLNNGYFPKELPPCFFTELLGNDFNTIANELELNKNTAQIAFENTANSRIGLTTVQIDEEKIKLRQLFKNRLNFSECAEFSIPKPGIARNIIKIPNPLHQGKLSNTIANNYSEIEQLFRESILSTTKPIVETEKGEGKRSIKHENYGSFKELCILNSFKFSIQLKTDIAKFYPSIYTHSIPWITFGGKERYKRNRALHKNDSTKISIIYGDDIDDNLMWCQNQQTIGIPIGPDTSFIAAEIVACHVDVLFTKKLKSKKIDFIGYRYYDDFSLYFNSELDAQIALTELKSILSDFELRINDDKTVINKTHNELESEWALAIKSFYFRPSLNDQKEDLWNFFSIAFKFSKKYPNESVLRLALNKFNFVRIEKDNWDFFESLIFRLGLSDTGALQKIAKLLVTYKSVVNKNVLKSFCTEIILRHYEEKHDYELTWSLWLLNEFRLQPNKILIDKILSSKSVTASILALDMLSKNKRIKKFDYSNIISSITTENLNTKLWLLVYESSIKGWIPDVSVSIVSNHFYFDIIKSKNIHFFDSNRKLEPLKTNRSNLEKIDRKVIQLQNYVTKNKISRKEIESKINAIAANLNLSSFTQLTTREKVQDKLTKSDGLIKELLLKVSSIQSEMKKFEIRKPYFVIEKRLEELEKLMSKEIESEVREDKNLLFDPKYEE
ncbi:MAG: RNA-directed DNA polymerase [Bacteroidales bacterium]|nr:RNA-directed DNA polymerase [Bacteroidales bacterium]